MTKIYLVRHGSTEWNHDKRAQGHADIELDAEGHRQAVAVAQELASLQIDAVYSSDLKRAVDTARPIAETHGLGVQIDPSFREIDQGEWTGLYVEEIQERWPDLWGPARHYTARPGGESPQQVRKRALEGVKRAVSQDPDGTVAIVSHGGTIRWMAAEALAYDDKRSARIRGLGNGGVVSIRARLEGDELVLGELTRLDGSTPDLDDPND